MDKKEAWKELLRLTPTTAWMLDPVKIETVQALARIANAEIKPQRKKNHKRVICVYHNGKLLIDGYAQTLCRSFGVSPQGLHNRARVQYVDSKGRQFKYLDEKKSIEMMDEKEKT